MTEINTNLALTYGMYAVINFILSGFLGGSETVFLSLNRILLYAKHGKNNLTTRALIYLVERSSQFLTGIVVLNNVTMILSTLFVSKIFIEVLHVPLLWAPVWTTIVMTPCTLIVAEVLPKSLGHSFADLIAYRAAFIWIVLYFVMYPISWALRKITLGFSFLFGFQDKTSQGMVRSEFQDLLDISLSSGALNTGERKFINNVLDFREVQANEAMIPLSQVVCIEKNQTVYTALELMKEYEVSTLPVYNSRIDDPIGYIRAKDLISSPANSPVEPCAINVFFVPETAYLEKILIQMQKLNMPLAFVADEYGGIVGILRIEDIVSEIMGEVIEDGDIEFKVMEDGNILASGLCDIDDLFDELKLEDTTVDSKTLSGFIMESLGRMPKVGDIVFKKPWYFDIVSLKGRRVNEVIIKKSIKNIKNNHSSIQQYFANKEQSEKDDFQTYLLTNCKLVQVTVNEVSEAFQLFDSQNHRGKGLAPHDLLKAFHIRAMRNDTTQLKINVDTKWQEYKNLEEVFKHKLYRIRKWTKHHKDLYFYKKKIGEFKGFNLKNHQYPFHNSLAHYSNYPDYMPNLVPRLQDSYLNSHTQLNQKIINGKHFFDYVDTYSHLHKILFENLNITDNKGSLDTLTEFKTFYSKFSRHDPHQYRQGDTYVRLLYEASILAFVDKYGEQELKPEIYQSIYKSVYYIRFRQKRVDEVSVLKSNFAKGFFNTLEHSYEPSEVLVFLNAFINNLKQSDINSPKLSNHMKDVFIKGEFNVR